MHAEASGGHLLHRLRRPPPQEGHSTIRAVVISEPSELDPYLADWDRLAVSCGQPFSAPAWMLAWWRHLAPPGGRLCVTVMSSAGRLVGIAPWYQFSTATGLRMARLIGTGHRVEPLGPPGRERELAVPMAAALHALPGRPGALVLDRADALSPWPAAIARAWPGHTRIVHREAVGAPVISLRGRDRADWLASRSGHFRSQRQRASKRLAARGAGIRQTEPGLDTARALTAFVDLSAERWTASRKGGGGARAMERMLGEAGDALVPLERMSVWVLEVRGAIASVQIFVSAGGQVAYWNGAFDPAWADLSPGFEATVEAVENAFGLGADRLDLGGGPAEYKRRLADGDAPVASTTIVPGGADRLVRLAQLAPGGMRRRVLELARRLPPGLQERLRQTRRAVANDG
jgi:CelD/BcsL family acetyltransferase involved in cellulose biosynthesis